MQMWMRRCFSEAALRSPLCVRVCMSVCVPACVRVQVVLFPFTDYPKMYPFPTTHPCDRQSMVDVAAPDLARFPRFADAQVAAPLPLPRRNRGSPSDTCAGPAAHRFHICTRSEIRLAHV